MTTSGQGILVATLALPLIKIITSSFFGFVFRQLIESPSFLKIQNPINSKEIKEHIFMVTSPTVNFVLPKQPPLSFSNILVTLTFSSRTEENVFPCVFFLVY